MNIAAMTFRLHAPWVHSLKEKRIIVKSLIAKLQNKFHVSAAEIDEQDTHQIIVIGVAAIVPHNAMADSLMEEISLFVEENTEADVEAIVKAVPEGVAYLRGISPLWKDKLVGKREFLLAE